MASFLVGVCRRHCENCATLTGEAGDGFCNFAGARILRRLPYVCPIPLCRFVPLWPEPPNGHSFVCLFGRRRRRRNRYWRRRRRLVVPSPCQVVEFLARHQSQRLRTNHNSSKQTASVRSLISSPTGGPQNGARVSGASGTHANHCRTRKPKQPMLKRRRLA